MKKMLNTENICGRVYQHDLKVYTVKKQGQNFGKEFIKGKVEIAVNEDEEKMNVIPINFSYVTEMNTKGRNSTFTALKKLIDGAPTWIPDGKENATKVKIGSSSLVTNDFYNNNDELVEAQINDGGIMTIVNELDEEKDRNTFNVDIVISKVREVEADGEKVKEPYVEIKGYTFNFKNEVFPVTLVVRHPGGMQYFTSLEVNSNNPVFTRVWGKVNTLVVKDVKTEESAFGEASVRTVEKKTKEWVVTGALSNTYAFGEEGVLTQDELTKALQDREMKKAEIKKARDDYKASTVAANMPASNVPVGNFNF